MSADAASPNGEFDGIQVLLVDDDQDFVTLAATLLETESEQIQTRTATSPEAVLEGVDLGTVDCVVSDYRMPDMNGIEFLETVREAYPQLPFILFTGKGDESTAEAAIAAGVSDYIVKNGSPEQYAISANRIENLVRQHRTQRRADRKRTLDGLERAIVRAILTEQTREAIEQGVCNRLVGSEYYSVAWVGELDPHSRAIRSRVWAGEDALRESVLGTTDDGSPQSIEAQALTTGELQLTAELSAETGASQWETAAADCGFRAALAVPINYEGIPYGVLGVYTERQAAFSDDELALFELITEFAGFAIAASDRRRGDTSRQVVDIEFDVTATELPFVELASILGSEVRLVQTVHQSDGTTLTRYRISDSAVDRAEIESHLDAESVQLFEPAGPKTELAVSSSEAWWEELIDLYGASVGDATANPGAASLRIELPTTTTVRPVVDRVEALYPAAKPVARRERTRPDRSVDDLRNLLGDRLTDRQLEVIETAYHAGYYEWPHGISSGETAELLGITQPTFAEHFWTAQRRIMDLLLETDTDDQ